MSAQRLWQAGYRDLVSVVPPDAEISPKSNLRAESRGKVPGVKRGGGLWSGYNWLKDTPTEADLQRWEAWGANVGLLAAHYPGLDIDCDDPQLARFARQEATRVLGPAPVRTSREPRRLLVYRTEEPFTRIAATIAYRGEGHTLEVLGSGRQYLVSGDHPSGNRYGWEGRPLWDWSPDSLTEITAEQVQAFFKHVEKRLAGRATVEIHGSGKTAAEDAPPQETLEAPSMDALAEVVDSIPNRTPDRADYIEIGCAVKAAGGEEAFDIWWDWCQRWEGGTNEQETAEADWSRMHPPFRVGFPWLREQAEQHGYDSAAEEFEVIDGLSAPEAVTMTGVQMLTDTWVVEQLAHMLKDTVRYVPETGQWHTWE